MTLEIYAVVLQLVRMLSPYLPALRARSQSLGDQLERALISVPLNLAEGAYSRGKNRQARYPSACASAREALACLETAEALGGSLLSNPRSAPCSTESSAHSSASQPPNANPAHSPTHTPPLTLIPKP